MSDNTRERSIKLLNRNLHKKSILWTQLLSIVTVVISLAIVFKKYPRGVRDIWYLSVLSLLIWLCGDIVISMNVPYQGVFHVLFQSLALSMLLMVFLIFIRMRKPIIFRYPYYIVFIPILVPLAQLIVMDADVMRQIIFMSLQGVSIFVFILLAIGYGKELRHKLLTIIGVILLLWGFAFYWILQNYFIVFDWAWGLTNSLGMIACIYSFSDLVKINTSDHRNS